MRGGVAGRLWGWGGWQGVGRDEGMVGSWMAGRVKGLLAGRGVGRASWVGADRWGGGRAGWEGGLGRWRGGTNVHTARKGVRLAE